MSIDLDEVRTHLSGRGDAVSAAAVAEALEWLGYVVSDATVLTTMDALRRDSRGAGPLEPLLRQPDVTDVVVNGPDQVFIDRGRGLESVALRFPSDDHVRRLAVRLAAMVGRRLDDGQPFVDARLPDGTRVHAVLASVAHPGTCLSLRVPSRVQLSLNDWVDRGSLTAQGVAVLRGLVSRKRAFLVSGGTGTGKTTLLASMLAEVPTSERLVIVEDSRELNPAHPHCVRMEGRPANAEGIGAITLTDLVRHALRMRPDRLIVGEVRGAELRDLLAALNTGHEGGCGTIHANSATSVPARLEALGALGGLSRHALHAQAAAALDAVIHIRRSAGGHRFIEHIGVVASNAEGLVEVNPAFSFDDRGDTTIGPAAEELARLIQ